MLFLEEWTLTKSSRPSRNEPHSPLVRSPVLFLLEGTRTFPFTNMEPRRRVLEDYGDYPVFG